MFNFHFPQMCYSSPIDFLPINTDIMLLLYLSLETTNTILESICIYMKCFLKALLN